MKTYTKKLVKFLVPICCLGGFMPFILSIFGREPVAELGIAWIASVMTTVVGYLCKSYLENKAQHRQELDDFLAGFDRNEDEEIC